MLSSSGIFALSGFPYLPDSLECQRTTIDKVLFPPSLILDSRKTTPSNDIRMNPIPNVKILLPNSRWDFAILLASVISAVAAPPDLNNGGVPSSTVTTYLGPTGLRGWVCHESIDSSKSRQIQVQAVDGGFACCREIVSR